MKLEEFVDGRKAPKYAILSHTWGSDEVLFHDMANLDAVARKKEGWKKIQYACNSALRDGIYFAWVDTCCIDKTSSAELSEAINSMFAWYRDSAVCYIYLADVTTDSYYFGDLPRLFGIKANDKDKEEEARHSEYVREITPRLSKSRWFTRGWTLQELLAPRRLEFYSTDWTHLGSGRYLIDVLSAITKIKPSVIRREETRTGRPQGSKTRHTASSAYCLLGIFGINMPLLYGEGEKAFLRLQREIIQASDDQTILACTHEKNRDGRSSIVLARSPASFANAGSYVPLLPPPNSSTSTRADLEVTLAGVHVSARLFSQHVRWNIDKFAVLNCIHENYPTGMIALGINQVGNTASSKYYVSGDPWIIYMNRQSKTNVKPQRFTLQDSWGQQSDKDDIRHWLRIRCVVEDATRFHATVLETFPPEAWQSSNLCRNRHWFRALRLKIQELTAAGEWTSNEMLIAFHDTRGRAFAYLAEQSNSSKKNSLEKLCHYLDNNFKAMREIAYSRYQAFTFGCKHHWFDNGLYDVCMIHDPFPTDDIHANLLILVEKRSSSANIFVNLISIIVSMATEDLISYAQRVFLRVLSRRSDFLDVGETALTPSSVLLDKAQFYDTTRQRFNVRLSAIWPRLPVFRIALFQALISTALLWLCYAILRGLAVRQNPPNQPSDIDNIC